MAYRKRELNLRNFEALEAKQVVLILKEQDRRWIHKRFKPSWIFSYFFDRRFSARKGAL